MDRKDEIRLAAHKSSNIHFAEPKDAFIAGAEWADRNKASKWVCFQSPKVLLNGTQPNDVRQWYLCSHKNFYGPYHFFIGYLAYTNNGARAWYDQDGQFTGLEDEIEHYIPITKSMFAL